MPHYQYCLVTWAYLATPCLHHHRALALPNLACLTMGCLACLPHTWCLPCHTLLPSPHGACLATWCLPCHMVLALLCGACLTMGCLPRHTLLAMQCLPFHWHAIGTHTLFISHTHHKDLLPNHTVNIYACLVYCNSCKYSHICHTLLGFRYLSSVRAVGMGRTLVSGKGGRTPLPD